MDTSHVLMERVPDPRGNARNRRHAQVYFETFFMAGVLSSQSYLQMKTLSAALEQSEEIMQWINVISARPWSSVRDWDAAVPSRHRRDSCPSHNEVGGFFFDFGAVRTVTRDRDAPRRS